ncbi:MAG: hypothetical protein NT166_18760 [Candidatus Aminicenantes bacterium]|nr:hypothetical protein [Candidatus Aminicenantes bacterium]
MKKYLLDTNICIYHIKGHLIDDFDLLIGCSAIANGLILVTRNEKHFNRLSSLKIENWAK